MDRVKIRIILVTLILVGIGGFAFFESGKLRHGPIITIESPRDGAVSNTPIAHVSGVAKNIVKISMNDREISIDPNGVFNRQLVLSKGSNIVKLTGEDRFGRRSESFVEILYSEPNEPLVQRNTLISDYQ